MHKGNFENPNIPEKKCVRSEQILRDYLYNLRQAKEKGDKQVVAHWHQFTMMKLEEFEHLLSPEFVEEIKKELTDIINSFEE